MDYHCHPLQIYYEDTDLSGLVYHANYLKYFERAREHLLGVDELVKLYYDEGVGFVVYKVELTFKDGARLGDSLEIRTKAHAQSEYRAVFNQSVWRPGGDQALVEGVVQLVCVDSDNRLVPLPKSVINRLRLGEA
jgi:tol-pal system-associated acyl-CoA thioesterase